MKTNFTLLTILSFLTFLNERSFAQSYLSLFGDSTTKWEIILNGACDDVCGQTFTSSNDTIINSKTYKKIAGLPGFVREDTLQGKAWCFDNYYNEEYLIMDLGLNQGDNFIFYDYMNEELPITIDSVYYINNRKHLQLNAEIWMCMYGGKVTFIEGSGTTAGLSYQRNLYGPSLSSYMLCHQKDGIKVTGNNVFNDSCNICLTGMNETEFISANIIVYPNPANGNLTIEVKDILSSNFNLKIYDLLGRNIYFQNSETAITTINVSNLSDGIYDLVIENGVLDKHIKFMKIK
jgi:hypothetical protein